MIAGVETIHDGIVIQLAPPHRWAGSFWTVDSVRKWGVRAYCLIPGQAGVAYIRLTWEEFEIVGPAPFLLGADEDYGRGEP